MKILFTILVVAAVTGSLGLSTEQRQKALSYAVDCVKTTGVPFKVAVNLLKGDFSTKGNKTKCFVSCVLQKAGFMSAQGDILEDAVVEKLSDGFEASKIKDVLKMCNQQGKDACDTAFKVYRCFHSQQSALT